MERVIPVTAEIEIADVLPEKEKEIDLIKRNHLIVIDIIFDSFF